jgi:Ca2+-binding RTX toxin-like protein
MANSADAIVQIGAPSASAKLQTPNALIARNQIIGTDGPDILFGTVGDDEVLAKAGDDIIFGTTGNDILNGGDGFDTVDYSDVAAPITLLPKGVFDVGSEPGNLISIEKIIGAAGQKNTIDGSKGSGPASFNINLATNQLTVNGIPNLPPLNFTVVNFVDVVGTNNADTIFGDEANNNLSGGGGNDTIRGAGGADILTGTSSTARGVGEHDILTGGTGVDKFILGDSLGSYYKGQGNTDFAQITDFANGEQIQLGSKETYSLQRNLNGFNLFTTTGGVQDLIAQVQFSGGIGIKGASLSSPSDVLTVDPLGEISSPDGAFSIASGQSLGIFTGA